ncbi:MAG: hypothetical protein AAFV80_13620, partial [Bacteroidota bacterium]
GKAVAPICREYGIKEPANPINFNHLAEETRRLAMKPLIQYTYFCLYLNQQFSKSVNKQPWSDRGNVKIDDFFITQPFFKDYLSGFNQHYWDWLTEMSTNERGFNPFDLSVNEKSLYKLVHGIEQRGGLFGLNKSWNYGLFDSALNKAERNVGDISPDKKLMKIFFDATEEIYKEKFTKS